MSLDWVIGLGSRMTNDADLAKRAAAGDREAVAAIYDRYAPLLRAILLDATGSLPEADELVQEVFLKALGGISRLRWPERLCGWLVGIARRQAAEYRRQAGRRRRKLMPLADAPSTPSESLSHETMSNEVIAVVRQAVAQLPERERIGVHIHYLCGEPAEVARQALGLSPAGFYKLLERARARLRVRLIQAEAPR